MTPINKARLHRIEIVQHNGPVDHFSHPGQDLRTAFHAGAQTQRVEESNLGSVEKREKESKEMGRQKETGRINRKLKKWKDLQEREVEPELRERKW